MAPTFLCRRSVCTQLLPISSHLSRQERIKPSAIRNRSYVGIDFFGHRRSLKAVTVQFSREALSVARGGRGGMDGEGKSTPPLAGVSDAKIGVQGWRSLLSSRWITLGTRKAKFSLTSIFSHSMHEFPMQSLAPRGCRLLSEELVVEGSKKIEPERKSDAEDGKETDNKNQEGVASMEGESFRLTGSCLLILHRGDITKWHKDGETDAIVNAANQLMLGGGGVDGAIHRAAGSELLEACLKVPEVSSGVRCPVGRAVITPGFKLPVAHVIHTVGPVYDDEMNPADLLADAYKNSVTLAIERELKYIAFPAISCGVYKYPYDEAAEVSIQVLQKSAGQLLEVHFVLFEVGTYAAWLAEAENKLERLKI